MTIDPINTYDPGDPVRIRTDTVFQDVDGTAFDPDLVTFSHRPAGATSATSKTYPTDAEVVKLATGDYYLIIDTTGYEGIEWYYKIQGFTSGGASRGVHESKFLLRSTHV